MTPRFGARRGAEEFHRSLEGESAGEHAELLALVGRLRAVPQAEPRAAFSADLRSRLMTEAATVLTPTTAKLTVAPRNPAAPRRERRLAVLVGGFAVASAATSMAVAAQSALPGEVLYPLKRALEDTSTSIRVDDAERAATILGHARGRLDEAAALSADDDGAEQVTATLHDFTDQAVVASETYFTAFEARADEQSIADLRTFASDSMGRLRALEPLVPEEARAALIEAAQVVERIDGAAALLCPACGPGVGEVPAAAVVAAVENLVALDPSPAPADPRPPAANGRKGDGGDRGRGGKGAETTGDAPGGTLVPNLPEGPDVDGPTGQATEKPGRTPVTNPIEQLGKDLRNGRQGDDRDLGDVLEDVTGGVGDTLGGLLGRG